MLKVYRRIKRIGLLAAMALALLIAAGSAFAQVSQAQSASPLGNKDAAKVETAVGDLVADAIREATDSNIAFVAASDLKQKNDPIAAGTVTSADIAGLISYPEDPLAKVQLTGKAVRQALEKAISIYPHPNLGFIQVSGISFTFDPKKSTGQRVTSITVGGSPISDTATYTIGMTNSLANGALGYWKVWSKDDVKQRYTETSITQAITNYLRAHSRIDYGNLNRITIVK